MKVKKYIAQDYQEAMKMVKAEMGSNAVILHQNKIRNKGIMGFFGKYKVEVVAAVEDQPLNNVNNIIKNDINELKIMIKKLNSGISSKDVAIKPQNDNKVLNKLLKYGINPELSEALAEGISSFNDSGIKTLQQRLISFMGIPQKLDTTRKKKVLFIGPTGVGKTTTIAKIASNLILNEKKKVILITADIFRIAAVEQLKTYGDILGVPVKVVNNIFEFNKLLPEIQEYDIALVDTAGRSHKDQKKINELKTFVKYSNCDETFLCLSATTKSEDLEKIIDMYKFAGDYKLLITKLDETDNLSSVINAKYYANRPLSYFTNGQIVPDDIYLANYDEIVLNIIKGN
ncbi:MAG: DEAD/DEAH box helicase family protein [Thermoanaerobacteraceae bacterium]